MTDRIGVLFVCLGNICRSPLAEGVFRAHVERAGLRDRFDIDSAGTSDYHIGDAPDPRTVRTAASRGVHLEHAARQLAPHDFERFDYVLAMDGANLRRIERMAEGSGAATVTGLLRAFDPDAEETAEVPDPYYGGPRGFEDVHDLVDAACRGLLKHLIAEHDL